MTDSTVVGVYVRCHRDERGGGGYIKVMVTKGQRDALIGGNPDLWEALEGIAKEVLKVSPAETFFVHKSIWVPRNRSPEEILSKEIREIDLSEESPPPEIWLAMSV